MNPWKDIIKTFCLFYLPINNAVNESKRGRMIIFIYLASVEQRCCSSQ